MVARMSADKIQGSTVIWCGVVDHGLDYSTCVGLNI